MTDNTAEKIPGNHTRQLKKQHLESAGVSISLTARYKGGVITMWGVTVRTTSSVNRQQRTNAFSNELDAYRHYAKIVENPWEAFASSAEGIEGNLDRAKAIFVRNEKQDMVPSLPLLYAVDRLRLDSNDPKYFNIQDASLRLMEGLHSLPSPHNEVEFEAWVKKCLAALFTQKITKDGRVEKAIIANDTANHRKRFFTRAMKVLVDFHRLFPSGVSYAARAARVGSLAKDAKKAQEQNIRDSEPIKPLGRAQFEEFLNSAPSVALKLYILKVVAGVFRAPEAKAANLEHVKFGKVNLREIGTKKKLRKKKIVNPSANLALRTLVRTEHEFGVSFNADDRRWLKNKKDYTIRCLRTTAACNLIFCGGGNFLETLRHRGGWSSLKVIFDNYDAYGLDDIGSSNSSQYYELPSRIIVQGIDVGSGEVCDYDRYILLLTLKTLRGEFENQVERIMEMVSDEVQERKSFEQVDFIFGAK